MIAINLNRLELAGGLHDPAAAIALCSIPKVDWNIVHGRVIVKDGHLLTIEICDLIQKHNRAAKKLLNPDY
jgi:hypothetical protein